MPVRFDTQGIDILACHWVCPDGHVSGWPLREPFDGQVTAYSVPDSLFADASGTDVARRLGRAQRLALAAASGAAAKLEQPLNSQSVGVYVGTGLGNLTDTLSFVRNMVIKNEKQPMPTKFINSVHNAIAAQVAIAGGWKAENHTFTHTSRSFEQAFHHGLSSIRAGRVGAAIVVASDALDSDLLAYMRSCERPDGELGCFRGEVPGEGAAAFVLAPCQVGTRTGRLSCAFEYGNSSDEDAVIDFVGKALHDAARRHHNPILLLGHHGDKVSTPPYRSFMRQAENRFGTLPPIGQFKHLCGEFYTAGAIGLALGMAAMDGAVSLKHLNINGVDTADEALIVQYAVTGERCAWRIER